jgi:hypothetical protein
MRTFGIVAGILAVLLVIFAGGIFLGYMSWSNDARQFEADIPAQYTQMQNAYDNGWKKVVEIAQVPTMQQAAYKDVYHDVMTGRYGAKGSQAMLQFIKEQNPTLDPALYTKIQQTIEIFHDQFEASQAKIIALKQSYQKLVTATTEGRIYNMVGGYPHIKCGVPAGSADDYQIVTSDKTQTDFQNHKSEPLNLLKK